MSACFSDFMVSSSSTRRRVACSSGVRVTCLNVSVRTGADDAEEDEEEDEDEEDEDGADAGLSADDG